MEEDDDIGGIIVPPELAEILRKWIANGAPEIQTELYFCPICFRRHDTKEECIKHYKSHVEE